MQDNTLQETKRGVLSKFPYFREIIKIMICEVDRFRVYFILLWVAHTKQFLPKRLPLVTRQK